MIVVGINDEVDGPIAQLVEEGNVAQQIYQFETAIRKFREGIALVPEPKRSYPAYAYLLAGVGDNYMNLRDWEAAEIAFAEAITAPAGEENAYIRMGHGQALYELNQIIEAIQELGTAYIIDKTVFEGEDPKYLELIQPLIEKYDFDNWESHQGKGFH